MREREREGEYEYTNDEERGGKKKEERSGRETSKGVCDAYRTPTASELRENINDANALLESGIHDNVHACRNEQH